MPTLDLEEMRTDYSYVISMDVVQDARRLLAAERPGGISSAVSQPATRARASMRSLEGLGREIWRGVDPKQYVDQLRREWDAR